MPSGTHTAVVGGDSGGGGGTASPAGDTRRPMQLSLADAAAATNYDFSNASPLASPLSPLGGSLPSVSSSDDGAAGAMVRTSGFGGMFIEHLDATGPALSDDGAAAHTHARIHDQVSPHDTHTHRVGHGTTAGYNDCSAAAVLDPNAA